MNLCGKPCEDAPHSIWRFACGKERGHKGLHRCGIHLDCVRALEAERDRANDNRSEWRDQCTLLETILSENGIDVDVEIEKRRNEVASR